MSRTKKLDLIKSSYRLAALIILISININILSAQTAGEVRKKGGPKRKGTQIGTTPTNTHKIGESYGGGIVFLVTDDGLQGLIAETQNQTKFCKWEDVDGIINNPSNHSNEGQKFTDWRLPTIDELSVLYLQKTVVGGFITGLQYWSSSEFGEEYVWEMDFSGGSQRTDYKNSLGYVRGVRAFNNNKNIGEPNIKIQKAVEIMSAEFQKTRERKLAEVAEKKLAEAAERKLTAHKIGESYGGGIVFHVTDNGLHGLIAETQDQGIYSFEDADNIIIRNPSNHSKEGQKFTDWYLPEIFELNLLYLKKDLVGGFAKSYYWSASADKWPYVWLQSFSNGKESSANKNGKYYVRAIRSF